MDSRNVVKKRENIRVWVLDVLGKKWPVQTTTDDDVIGVLIDFCRCTTLGHATFIFDCNVRKTRVSCIIVFACTHAHTHEQLCLRVHTQTHTEKHVFWYVCTYTMCMCS